MKALEGTDKKNLMYTLTHGVVTSPYLSALSTVQEVTVL